MHEEEEKGTWPPSGLLSHRVWKGEGQALWKYREEGKAGAGLYSVQNIFPAFSS